jgi:hypothetical protein
MDNNSKLLSQKIKLLKNHGGSFILSIGDYYVQFCKNKKEKQIYFEAVSYYFLDILPSNLIDDFLPLGFKIINGENYSKTVNDEDWNTIIEDVQYIFQKIYKINYDKNFEVIDNIEYPPSENLISNSKVFRNNIENDPSQKPNYFALILIFGAVLFICYNIFHKESPTDETNTEDKRDSFLPANTAKNYLLSSAQEFKNNFNSFCANNGIDLYIKKMQVENGSVNNSVAYTINQQIAFVGVINKSDNTLNGVTMIGQGNGTPNSGTNVILAMLCLIASVDPSLSADQRGHILKQLGMLNKDNDILNLSDNFTVNGIKYFINSSHQIGIMFGAEVPQN